MNILSEAYRTKIELSILHTKCTNPEIREKLINYLKNVNNIIENIGKSTDKDIASLLEIQDSYERGTCGVYMKRK